MGKSPFVFSSHGTFVHFTVVNRSVVVEITRFDEVLVLFIIDKIFRIDDPIGVGVIVSNKFVSFVV